MDTTGIVTVKEAKEFIQANVSKGAYCPCCSQHVMRYKLFFHRGTAITLLYMDEAYRVIPKMKPEHYIHVENYLVERGVTLRGVHAKAKFWGLIEPQPTSSDRKIRSNGYWRLTDKGRKFVAGKVQIPSLAMVFNDHCDAFGDEMVSISDVIKNSFDYKLLKK